MQNMSMREVCSQVCLLIESDLWAIFYAFTFEQELSVFHFSSTILIKEKERIR